jgi:hypothetical protein
MSHVWETGEGHTSLWQENLNEGHLDELDADGRIILKCISMK